MRTSPSTRSNPVTDDLSANNDAAERGAEPPTLLERLSVLVQLRTGLELKTVAALAGLLLIAAAFAAHHYWTGRPQPVAIPAAVAAPKPSPASPAAHQLMVDVAGKVRHPGVRRLPPGSRVADALRAAGGALPGADTTSLNLARAIGDGEQLLVGTPPQGPAPLPAGAGPTAAAVSLNSATLDQLETLPGVGPVLGGRIIDFRTQHGTFTSISQLRNVTGIGDRRFADLKPLVTL